MREKALSGPHADLVRPIAPGEDSLFVVKARHSIFYETPLNYLLLQQSIDHVVLCGQVAEQCVLHSALDAHIRHLRDRSPRRGRPYQRGSRRRGTTDDEAEHGYRQPRRARRQIRVKAAASFID
jgi:nicotinamidase-related amidase